MSSPRPSPSAGRPLRSVSGSLPPPPNAGRSLRSMGSGSAPGGARRAPQTSMTIEEMRHVHKRALSEAEAKRTELRLVLASRYRELVGSSDEVLRMGERAKELHELVHALPSLMDKLVQSTTTTTSPLQEEVKSEQDEESEAERLIKLRRELSRLPRVINRALDKKNVHQAATSLVTLFGLIASHTDEYPLANALSDAKLVQEKDTLDPVLAKQMKMTYLHVEALPAKTKRLSKIVLQSSAADSANKDDMVMGARQTAAALSTLKILDVKHTDENATELLDLYFDSKATLLQSLLSQLATTSPSSSDGSDNKDVDAENAEDILSKIVLILQYDIILHPYLVFVKRDFPAESPRDVQAIMATMPAFETDVISAKVSHFLAAHLPLIRTKVKSILVTIAGTTASALGKIRQSLYDKTDGVECIQSLDSNGIATWEEAVSSMVDLRIVHSHGSQNLPDAASKIPGQSQRKFSLWSALFSNTFSSLVHSLLTTSFHSVHARVVSSLRTSLANAPPFSAMLPHEAYRNTLRIATELDAALLKVSDDAHELLVHAEEREESERRLRQSLYVQTCEIMGRLVCELRRMLFRKSKSESHATKEFIVGRLCHLLKFRLTSLPTLLNPSSSPAALLTGGNSSGMITLYELQSAFELADDNDDGLITFEEAMESVDSAFSGTQFHGAELVRETLLLGSKPDEAPAASSVNLAAPSNVTLDELTLLSARGLRHESAGRNSALGTIQSSLDDIISSCFSEWASAALESSNELFKSGISAFLDTACSTDEAEWQRTHRPSEASSTLQEFGEALPGDDLGTSALADPVVENVSPYVIGYMESVSSILSRSVCPSDSLKPVPSAEYAATLGITADSQADIPSLMDTIRWAILGKAVQSAAAVVDDEITGALVISEDFERPSLKNSGPSALIQLDVDLGFLLLCFFQRNLYGFGGGDDSAESARVSLSKSTATTTQLLRTAYSGDVASLRPAVDDKHRHALEVCDLFLSALFGDDVASRSGDVDVTLDISSAGSSTPLFHPPLPSSRRFTLLPIQTDRSISELQRRGKLGKDKEAGSDREEAGAGVIGSGLGFFSSMLKKK
jgi:hypothetical protein